MYAESENDIQFCPSSTNISRALKCNRYDGDYFTAIDAA
jgi:hypothetical protein